MWCNDANGVCLLTVWCLHGSDTDVNVFLYVLVGAHTGGATMWMVFLLLTFWCLHESDADVDDLFAVLFYAHIFGATMWIVFCCGPFGACMGVAPTPSFFF